MAAEDPEWQVGDVIAGVGWLDYFSGQYWIFDSTGTPKLLGGVQQTATDVWPKQQGTPWGMATGCAFNAAGDLYTTSMVGLTVAKFAAGAPHARTLVNTINYTSPNPDPLTGDPWSVFAIETIAFDNLGNYWVGGQGTPPNSPAEEPLQQQRTGFIFKFNAAGVQQAVYEVPIGNRGVDQIDIGTDQTDPTIFYTSEDTVIRVFRPNQTAASGFREQRIVVREQGQPESSQLGGSLYAIRALPPQGGADNPLTPINESLQPAGFLVASSTDVLWVRPSGEIERRYLLDANEGVSGQRFALNITPDGQSFWTATYPGGGETYPPVANPPAGEPNSVGHLLKFHIPTGKLLVKRQVGAGAVWGLCVKREYTAASNVCYVTDANGVAVDGPDADTLPDTTPCEVPHNCVGTDDPHEDCRLPGAPEFAIEVGDRTDPVDSTVTHPALAPGESIATSPTNALPLTYSAQINNSSTLPPGIAMDSQTGVMSGTLLAAGTFTVSITVTDNDGRKASDTFIWTVTPKPAAETNVPPVLQSHPDGASFTVTVATPHQLTFTAFDEDNDAIFVAAQYRLVGDLAYTPGLPPGYALTGTQDLGYTPARPVPAGYAYLGMLVSGSAPRLVPVNLVNGVPAVVTPVGTYEVSLAIMDNPAGSYWCRSEPCDAQAVALAHDWSRPEQNQQFTIHVVNRDPVVTVAPQKTLVGTTATYTISALDADGHPLTYSISGLPSGEFSVSGNVITANPTVIPAGGSYTVSVTVSDPYGGSVTTSFTWTIFDNRAPVCDGANASHTLWPPNHMFVPIKVVGVTDEDNDTITITITGIRQDEPVFTQGSGNTGPDAKIVGDTAYVRAERTGVKATPGNGRIYEIFFTATDGQDSCSGTVTVGVPHDQGQMRMPLPNPGRWNSLTGAVIIIP